MKTRFAFLPVLAVLLAIAVAPAADEFTIVVLPDTQKYAASYPEIFTAQTQWIVDNKDTLNIVFVTHEGDIVNTWNSITEWDRANTSISMLDGVVPYSVVPGDHDHYGEDPPGSTEYYEQYFPASRFSSYPWWGESYAGNYGGDYNEDYPHTNNNNYQLLTIGGQDYIFLSLDFCPSQDEIDWANGVLTTYSDRRAILTTHALLDTNANYYGSGDFWLYPDGSSNSTGDTSLIWYDLIRNHENLQMVLCGHMHGEARRTDDNMSGQPVHQLLANYQGRTNGGDGWLRIMRFVPAEDKVYVETYSPWLDSYETDPDSQFTLDFPMGPTPPTASLIVPLDNGPDDLEPDDDEVTVNTTQASFQIQLSDVGDGVDDTTVTAAMVDLTKDEVLLIEGTTEGSDYSFSYDAGLDVIRLTPAGGDFGNGLYVITLSETAKIKDLAGNEMATTILAILIDTSIVPPVTLTFQQDVDGYESMVDTMIRFANPDDNYADSATQYDQEQYQYQINSDTDSGGGPSHVLLRFDDIISPSGPIPAGSEIVSATLRIRSTDDGNGGRLHPVLLAWVDTVVTWNNSFGGNGVQANDTEAASAADDSIGQNDPGTDVDLDVTATVQAWADGIAVNKGWAILPNGSNGWHMAAAEHPTVGWRPELIVDFITMGNRPPVARAGPDQTVTDTDQDGSETVTLDGSASSDPDGTIMSYEWDIDGDEISDYTGETVLDVLFGLGTHTVTLTVTDDEGATDTDDVMITVSQPDYDAYVSQDATVTYGLVGGGIEGTMTAGDSLVQTITEVPNGKGGMASLQVEYNLNTTANRTDVTVLELYLDATWTAQDTDDPLVVQIWNGSSWENVTADIQDGSFVPDIPQDYVDDGGNIHVLFTDTAAVKKEKKDTLTIDLLYAQILTGPVNNPPSVTINQPSDGSTFASSATIAFEGTATDIEDGELTASLLWESSIDGSIGTGGSFSVALSDGEHLITASVTDSGGETAIASVSITVGEPPPDTTPPSAPTGLVATPGDSQVSLDWGDNTESDLAGYNVYRKTEGGSYNQVNGALVTASAYVDSTAENGITYYYIVTAEDDGLNESGYSDEVSATPQAQVGDVVTITKAEYKAAKSELNVEATSTGAPDAVLTVVGYEQFGVMTYDSRKNIYKLKMKPAVDPGSTVTVTSEGGSDTAPVTHK